MAWNRLAGFAPRAACRLRPPVATSIDGVFIAYHMAYGHDANGSQNYNDVKHT